MLSDLILDANHICIPAYLSNTKPNQLSLSLSLCVCNIICVSVMFVKKYTMFSQSSDQVDLVCIDTNTTYATTAHGQLHVQSCLAGG